MKISFILKILFICFVTFQSSFASKQFNVTFVSASSDDDFFGNMSHSFAKASANDLNINLDIKIPIKSLDKFDYLESLKEVFERETKPDFIIAKFFDQITVDILTLSETNNIPIFIINSNVSKSNKKIVGNLRRKFENYIGHIAPNDKQVGYDLAKYLINYHRQSNPDGRLKISAIATDKLKIKTKLRLQGLEKAVKEEYRTKLYKTVYSPSNSQEAYIKASRLIKKYYDLNIIWTETGMISLGANEAIVDNSLSEQAITGGVGFTKEVINAVKNNKIKAIIGGDFMDAGFALVLINDYLNGKDFYEEFNSKIDSNMFLITSENVNKYGKIFDSFNWEEIDFKKYSKIYNKNLKSYNFSLKNLFIN
jgi:ABC-type sugar transport system substrate-binding protein